MFDGGTFLLFNALAFGTLIVGISAESVLAKPLGLISILTFMFLAFSLLNPVPVGITTTTNSTTKNFNVTANILMTNSTHTESSGQVWIGPNLTKILPWLYFGFSFMPLYFLVKSTFGKKEFNG